MELKSWKTCWVNYVRSKQQNREQSRKWRRENKENIRIFESGATRDSNQNKLDYEGFLSPLVLKRYAEYMHKHRLQSDGKLRDSDNWQRGMPKEEYIKSAWRHFIDWWMFHRGYEGRDTIEEALCALLFNTMGYMHELEKEKLIIPNQHK